MIPIEARKCRTCGIEKDLSEFYKPFVVNGKIKRHSECKPCQIQRSRKWNQSNKERFVSNQSARYIANREEFRAVGRENYRNNRERHRAVAALRRRQNLERIRSQDRAIAKRWRAAHPEKAKQWSAKQRAIKRNVQLQPITKQQIDDLCHKQRGRCAICKKKLVKRHIDHVKPLSRGGAHEILNFQLLCPRCNLTKRAADPIDFMQKLGFLL